MGSSVPKPRAISDRIYDVEEPAFLEGQLFNFAAPPIATAWARSTGCSWGFEGQPAPGVRRHEPKTHMRAFIFGTSLSVIGSI